MGLMSAPRWRRDSVAGAVTMLAGLLAAVEGYEDDIGSVTDMGAGFFPFVLGVIMILLGGLIAVSRAAVAEDGAPAMPVLDRRGAGCILGGMVLFLVAVHYGGLIPAAFVATFVAAWGDRRATLIGTLSVAALAALIGLLLFHEALKLPLALFRWG